MTSKPQEKLADLLDDFSVAMLVTQTPAGQLRARPMAIGEVQPDGTVWLVTQRQSAKLDEISREHQVNLTMQSSTKFVSISGTATVVEDRPKVAELWSEYWQIWFPGGKDDPSLILLRVDGETGEYWDNSGASGISYLIEAGKAYLTGTRPQLEDDPKIHGKVAMERGRI